MKFQVKTSILAVLFAFVLALTALAATPDLAVWDYVTADSQGNQMYIKKDQIKQIVTNDPNRYVFEVVVAAIGPNGKGSFYEDIISHTPNYGNIITHKSIWSFYRWPTSQADMMTPTPMVKKSGPKTWYSANGQDAWFKAEFDYVVKSAKKMGIPF